MGLLDLSPYKVTNNLSAVDASTQDSMIDAIQAVVNALVDANVAPGAAIAYTKLALTGSLVNTDVAAAAAIAISKLADPGVGKVIGSSGGAATAIFAPGYEFGRTDLTSNVTVSGTSGAQTSVVTGPPITSDGTLVVYVEFFFPEVISGVNDAVNIELWEDSTDLGTVARAAVSTNTTPQFSFPIFGRFKRTIPAGTHQHAIKAWRGTANGTIKAGAGGAVTMVPGYIRIVQA